MKGKTMSNKIGKRGREENYGVMNAHTVGRLMKEAAWRALMFIREKLDDFNVTAKETPGKKDDVFTDIDEGAQEIYVSLIRESFPTYGLIGEEGQLSIPCRNRRHLRFVVDPIDGTKAFVRGEPFGNIGTMIALAEGSEIISAWVGDVMSQQLFGYRPASGKTHRLVGPGPSRHLEINRELALADQYVLLRTGPEELSESMSQIVRPNSRKKIFRKYEVYGGSIGTWAVRLWNGNVGGLVLDPGHDAPWDIWPIIGICRQMGFVFLRFNRGKLALVEMPVSNETVFRKFELLVVHKSRLPELRSKGLMYCRGVIVD